MYTPHTTLLYTGGVMKTVKWGYEFTQIHVCARHNKAALHPPTGYCCLYWSTGGECKYLQQYDECCAAVSCVGRQSIGDIARLPPPHTQHTCVLCCIIHICMLQLNYHTPVLHQDVCMVHLPLWRRCSVDAIRGWRYSAAYLLTTSTSE